MDFPDSSEPFEDFFEQMSPLAPIHGGLSADWMKGEPTLAELLEEPIARLLMARDHVDPDLLEELMLRRFAA